MCVEVLSGGFVCQGVYVLPIVVLHRMGNYTRCTKIITLVDVRYVNMLDVLICQKQDSHPLKDQEKKKKKDFLLLVRVLILQFFGRMWFGRLSYMHNIATCVYAGFQNL